MAIKVLANTVAFTTSANNVYNATAVRITNNGTARTVTIANTATPTDSGLDGNYPGGQVTIRLNANEVVTVRKRPNDTITANSGVFGTKVAEVST
jgi:hypothetical protein|tara:strand:- start:185 stop:469 length:285 start_codon:yes stop_codon:yes gene_type:complete